MKNWLKENWFRVGLLAILVVLISGIFYWYEWRPSRIMIGCNNEALLQASGRMDREDMDRIYGQFKYSQKEYESYFDICLKNKGLEK